MSRQAKAQRRYERLWNRVSSHYGAEGMPAPKMTFGEPLPTEGGMYVKADETGTPTVYMDPRTVRRLSSTKKQARDKRGEARSRLLHEWAHVYQDRNLLTDPYEREGGANVLQRKLSRRLLHHKGGALATPPSDQMRAFKAKYGKAAWKRAQFGSNWGMDPTQIKYPSPPTGAAPPAPPIPQPQDPPPASPGSTPEYEGPIGLPESAGPPAKRKRAKRIRVKRPR